MSSGNANGRKNAALVWEYVKEHVAAKGKSSVFTFRDLTEKGMPQ